MHLPHACALETTFTAEDWSGTIELLSLIDGEIRNSGVDRMPGLSSDHLVATVAEALWPKSTLQVCETSESQIRIAVATRTRSTRGAPRSTAPR